ncbi:MAG: hypothetical protein ACREL5_03380 [Gemmatimonadales bacterium]
MTSTTAASQAPGKLVLAVNSTVAFVGAFTLTTFVHELGHFVSYLAFGAHPVLYFNQVQADDSTVSLTGVIVSALAGPVASLVQGILCAWWVRARSRNRRVDLFVQWLALFGFINFFGYLMLTPLSSVGDTGKVAGLLGFPAWLSVLIALAGIAVVIVIVIRQDRYFGGFLHGEAGSGERARWINALVYFPVLAGSGVNVAFAFPISTAISAIYPATSSLTVLVGYAAMRKLPRSGLPVSPASESISYAWIAVTVALLVINRLLVRGV